MIRLFNLFRRPAPKAIPRRILRTFAPRLEALEDRWVPTTFSWFQSVDGNYTDSSKWHDPMGHTGVPGAGDDANIPGGIRVTINSGAAAHLLNAGGTNFTFTSGGSLSLGAGNSSMGATDLAAGSTVSVASNGGLGLGTNSANSLLAGTISVGSAATLNLASFALSGNIDAASLSNVNMGGQTMLINAGATLTGAGQFTHVGSAYFGPTITLNTTLAAPQNFTLNTNGIINGTGTLNVSGTLNWLLGTMGGTGVTNFQSGSTVNVKGGVGQDTRQINNSSTVNIQDAGQIQVANNAIFNNMAGATVFLQNSLVFYQNGTFNNAGTLTKTAASAPGISTANTTFNNTGTVQVLGGELLLQRDGANTGVFNVPAGSTLSFGGAATYTLGTGASFPGTGLVEVEGDNENLIVNTNLTIPNLQVVSGTVTVNSGTTLTIPNGGALNLDRNLNGAGNVVIASGGSFNWTGGVMSGTGSTTIQSGANFNILSSSSKSFSRNLTTAGTSTWNGTGALTINQPAVWTNSGTLTVLNDQTLNGNSAATINNSGTWTKNSASTTGGTAINAPFNNSGTVNVTKGVLQLNLGGTSTGTFTVSGGQILDFESASLFNFNAGSVLKGTGTYLIGNCTFSVNTNLTVANVLFRTGTLTGASNLTVTGVLSWLDGGTMTGTGATIVSAGGTLGISGPNTKVLATRTLTNAGTGTWTGTADWQINDAGVFNNSGTFTIQNDRTIQSFGSIGTINNTGTWTKTSPGGSGTSTIGALFNNTAGSTTVTSGVLALAGGGTSSKPITVSAGQTISFAGSTYILASGATLNGSGNHRLDNGTLTVAGNLSVARFTLTGGTLNVTGALTVTTTLTWNGASTLGGTGTATVPAGATLAISGPGVKVLDTVNFVNAGTGTWAGTGSMQVNDSSVFNNTGTFTIQSDQTVDSSGTIGTINNSGTWTKTSPVGTGTTSVNAAFNNTGTVNVTTGVLVLHTGTSTGTFNTASGRTLAFANNHTLNSGAKFIGAGYTDVTGGTLTANAAVTATNFALENGATFTGAGTLTITGTFNWNGGAITGPMGSLLVMSPGSKLYIQTLGGKTLNTRTLTIGGSAIWTDAGNINLSTAVINVNQGASFNIYNDQTLSGSGTINNDGLFIKRGATGGTSTIAVTTFNNTRKVEAAYSGTLDITAAIPQVSGHTLTAGTWFVFGTSTDHAALNLHVSGGITTIGSGATVTLYGPNSNFVDLAQLASNAGFLNLQNGANFATAGSFTNSGTLTVEPASLFTINGNFTQTSAGTLAIQIGGTSGSPTVGSLKTTGSVSLAGNLSVSATVTPAIGTAFTILDNVANSVISGIFLNKPENSTFTVNGMTFRINYVQSGGGHDVVITRTA